MKYEKVKELSFRHYPRLYLHEDDLLLHLFFTNGNGYTWFNGELVYLTYDSDDNPRPITEEELVEQNNRHREQMYQDSIKLEKERDLIWDEIFPNKPNPHKNTDPYYESQEEEIKYRESSFKLKPEVQCWYRVEGSERNRFGHIVRSIYEPGARVMHLPDDIKPDWLDAADKAIHLAESPYCRMMDKDRAYIEKAKARIVEIKSQR